MANIYATLVVQWEGLQYICGCNEFKSQFVLAIYFRGEFSWFHMVLEIVCAWPRLDDYAPTSQLELAILGENPGSYTNNL